MHDDLVAPARCGRGKGRECALSEYGSFNFIGQDTRCASFMVAFGVMCGRCVALCVLPCIDVCRNVWGGVCSGRGKGNGRMVAVSAAFACGLVLAVAVVTVGPARPTQLGMTGDISTMDDIHSAYIHGSVPTSKGESDDIMNLNFPDERNGADSKSYQPAAYVRGSVSTAGAEATNIVNRTWTGAGMKKAPVVSLKAGPTSSRLHASSQKLAMMDDIATINDIHSAYIHGSVPTAQGESDDIMDLNFPDEVGSDVCIVSDIWR